MISRAISLWQPMASMNRNGPILVGENMAVDQDARDLKAEGIRDDYHPADRGART